MEIRDYKYILIPNILEKHKCIMCGDCCKDKWRIDVDKQSYLITKKKLEKTKENIDIYITKNENGKYVCNFSEGYCNFITVEKKCKIHSEFGWECLSDTCKTYPKNLKLSSRGLEIGMSFSCRASAKLLLTKEKFEIKKIKKEDYFIMKPRSVSFIIPENNLKNQISSRYYDLEEMIINILNLDINLYIKLMSLMQIFDSLDNKEIQTFDFMKAFKQIENSDYTLSNSKNLENEIIKVIHSKEKRSKSVGVYFSNILRVINLDLNLEQNQKILNSDAIILRNKDLEELKMLWKVEYDEILKKYFLCNVFNKEIYENLEYFMMKSTILISFLKFRILLNIKYLQRELTEEEFIYTIKSHEEDFSHDNDFFLNFYKEQCDNKISINNFTKTLLNLIA